MCKNCTFVEKECNMIKIGDKVKFLNDVGGGTVTGYVSKTMVNVENEDGFEIPYLISQLLNIGDPNLNIGAEKLPKEQASTEIAPQPVMQPPKGEIINGKNSPDFYFCLVPNDPTKPIEGEIQLYMVNDSNYTVLYRYSHFSEGQNVSVKHGTIQSNSKTVLETLTQNDLSDLPEFGFQLIYFREEESDWNEAVSKRFKINPVKFYKESSFGSNLFFKKNAMVLQITKNIQSTEIDKLTQEDFQKLVEEKKPEQMVKRAPAKRNAEIVEVDLHINELVDNPVGLSNHEILEIQKEKVESEMKLAIQNRVARIVFIHGVGQGVLKQEVINLLKSKFRKYYFQDASFREYGYGATMVILRKGN